MKKSTLLITTGVLLIAAASLLPCPHGTSGTSAATTSKPTKIAHRRSVRPDDRPSRSQRPDDGGETANLAAWQSRFDALLAEKGNREDAILQLLQEIDALYHAWVSDQLLPVVDRPPGERYDELADIEHSVSDGTSAILDQLGIGEARRLDAAGSPAEKLSAEVQYAEAARDSDSRLALLRLDRERQSRLEQAFALGDEEAKLQAVAELDAWYDAGLGKIFSAPDTGSDDEQP
jgi:hypothetical protein